MSGNSKCKDQQENGLVQHSVKSCGLWVNTAASECGRRKKVGGSSSFTASETAREAESTADEIEASTKYTNLQSPSPCKLKTSCMIAVDLLLFNVHYMLA